jgi:gliding motility-associated-like protein
VSNLSTNGNSYQWLFENGVPSTSTSFNSETMFPEGIEGTYTITLITTSDWGCIDTMILPINVYPETLIYAPNSFTPDGDEFNQTWQVYMTGIDFYDFELLIYNRWGELIWESNNIEIGWDGTYKNQICPTGIYLWTIKAKNMINDSKVTYKGHLTLLK